MINTLSITLLKAILLAALILCFSAISPALANSPPAKPVLAFSDLVNGPATGLGDGLGEGAIVTVWGYHFGEQQGQVFFTDSTGQTRPAAHIYYWKKADGKLPGGPANLYDSHRLYEIAFSLPTTTLGAGKITLQHNDGTSSNSLPFTAISGRIFHIKVNGNNLNDGSFATPWQFLNGDDYRILSAGNGRLTAGDVVYFHGTTERLGEYAGKSTRAAIFLRSINGRADAHVSMVSYPGTQTLVESPTTGIYPYLSSGIIISKFTVKGGLLEDPNDNSPTVPPKSPSTAQIKTSANGRIVANALTDMAGRCSNGYAGAITGSQNNTDNVSILGNEIYEIGCRQTSHFHHTTYMTRRSQTGEPAISAGEFAWNHLRDNMAKYGIHYYDQSNNNTTACDQVTGTLRIHNNYIVNQRSVAISVRTAKSSTNSPCWEIDTDIYNNIILNSGLGPVAERANGTQPYAFLLGGDIAGSFRVFNNLVVSVSDAESRQYEPPAVIKFTGYKNMTALTLTNNIIQPNFDMKLVSGDDAEIRANLIASTPNNSLLQRFFGKVLTSSEQLNYFAESGVIHNGFITLEPSSAAIGNGIYLPEVKHDFYGNEYDKHSPTIGPIQYFSPSDN